MAACAVPGEALWLGAEWLAAVSVQRVHYPCATETCGACEYGTIPHGSRTCSSLIHCAAADAACRGRLAGHRHVTPSKGHQPHKQNIIMHAKHDRTSLFYTYIV